MKIPLDGRDGQSFYLSVKPLKVVIKYTTEYGLENAVYTYLGILGFHWYGPTQDWFVSPQKLNQKVVDGKWFSPTFRNRSINGTGGLEFGTIPSYDLKMIIKKIGWYLKEGTDLTLIFLLQGTSVKPFM